MAWNSIRFLGFAVVIGPALYFFDSFPSGDSAYLDGFSSDKRDEELRQKYKQVQHAASAALKRLSENGTNPFLTGFSTVHSVLQEQGFPLTWHPCTLEPLVSALENYQQRNETVNKDETKPLHMFVLGGSSTAHSAKHCSSDHHSSKANNSANTNKNFTKDPFSGRYSNILMEQLSDDFFSTLTFDIVNMGQGASDTVWNALMLDELVDAQLLHGADILIVEYGINDALGGTTKLPFRTDQHLAQMMNVWLWRVWSLFHSSGREPPPILFVYLWDADFYRPTMNTDSNSGRIPGFEINKEHLLQQGIGQTSWKAQHHVLEHYRSFGWSIGAINVGAIANKMALSKNPGLLLDDKHHPNCDGMHLITGMIRHFMYSDLAQCSSSQQQSYNASSAHPMAFRPSDDRNTDTLASDLAQMLLDKQVTVGSIMEWEPNVGSSSLTLGKDSEHINASHVEPDVGTKSYPGRADRKQSFTLPLCGSSNTTREQSETVHFTLLEPSLRWLGIGYHIFAPQADTDATQRVVIEMTLNGKVILLTDDLRNQNRTNLEFDEVYIVKDWIRLADHVQQPAPPEYTLNFCYRIIDDYQHSLNIESEEMSWAYCPYENATNIQGVCNLWDEGNEFAPSDSCPYANLTTTSEACYQWAASELVRLEGNTPSLTYTEDSANLTPPQLNWIVGVIRDYDNE